MKINANNFTGYLSNGNRYKIIVSTKKSPVANERMLRIEMYESHKMFNTWMYSVENSQTFYYSDKESYITNLRKGLTILENKIGVQLLKANLTAVA